jgi:hypothetical protein
MGLPPHLQSDMETLRGILPKEISGRIPEEALSSLFPFSGKMRDIRELMEILEPALGKEFVPNLERYPLSKREMKREFERLKRTFESIGLLFDLDPGRFDIYLTTLSEYRVSIENTIPPSIMVPTSVIADFTQKEIRFIASKSLFHIARRDILTIKLTTEILYPTISELIKLAHSDSLERPEKGSFLESILRNIPAEKREALREICQRLEHIDEGDIKGYRDSVEMSGYRAGLLLSMSLSSSFDTMKKILGIEKTLPFHELYSILPFRDLFNFSISKEYSSIRAQMGIAL